MYLGYDIGDRVMKLSNPSSRKAQEVAKSAVAGGTDGESRATAAMRKEAGGGRKEESDPEARKLIGPMDVTAVNTDGHHGSDSNPLHLFVINSTPHYQATEFFKNRRIDIVL